ncbi:MULTISPECIES: YceI family protein [unclassified Curtobacterium]|uniref:YceI family protein n=1 Tax=unclassified Curtobacterium TaxID=257496 RepID=UPI00381F9240
MRRRTKVLIGVASGVVVLGAAGVIGGPVIYANVVNGAADAAPTLAPTGGATLDPAQADGDWTSSADSFAGYRVHEVLRGQDVTVTGRTKDVEARATVADGSLTGATVTVQVASIATPESARDEYFRSQALQTDRFPTATFRVTDPVDVRTALAGTDRQVTLRGDLTMHGVTKPVSADAQLGVDGSGHVQVAGSILVTFEDYGVQAPDLGFVTVDGHGAVEFSLELAK